jgi:hypothetical protein
VGAGGWWWGLVGGLAGLPGGLLPVEQGAPHGRPPDFAGVSPIALPVPQHPPACLPLRACPCLPTRSVSVAWAGDSRAVLGVCDTSGALLASSPLSSSGSSSGSLSSYDPSFSAAAAGPVCAAVPLTEDHKPDRPAELARISAAGGRVTRLATDRQGKPAGEPWQLGDRMRGSSRVLPSSGLASSRSVLASAAPSVLLAHLPGPPPPTLAIPPQAPSAFSPPPLGAPAWPSAEHLATHVSSGCLVVLLCSAWTAACPLLVHPCPVSNCLWLAAAPLLSVVPAPLQSPALWE